MIFKFYFYRKAKKDGRIFNKKANSGIIIKNSHLFQKSNKLHYKILMMCPWRCRPHMINLGDKNKTGKRKRIMVINFITQHKLCFKIKNLIIFIAVKLINIGGGGWGVNGPKIKMIFKSPITVWMGNIVCASYARTGFSMLIERYVGNHFEACGLSVALKTLLLALF